jgi:hypothetical protein
LFHTPSLTSFSPTKLTLPFPPKKQVFYLSLFGIFWYTTNATWNGLRNKLSAEHVVHYVHGGPQHHHPPPPATPSRHASSAGQQLQYGPGTPFHHQPPPVGYYGWPADAQSQQQQQQTATGADLRLGGGGGSPRKAIELN